MNFLKKIGVSKEEQNEQNHELLDNHTEDVVMAENRKNKNQNQQSPNGKQNNKKDEENPYLSIGVDNQKYKIKYPIQEEVRERTDTICQITFLLVTIVFIFISLVGLFAGNLNNLMQPYDEYGNACGRVPVQDYPYLYLTTLDPKKWTKNNVCVKTCPEENGVDLDCFHNKRVKDCNSDIKVFSSTIYMGRFCYPDGETLEDEAKKKAAKHSDTGQQGFVDMKNSWILVLTAYFLAIIFGIIFLYSIRACAATTITVIAISLVVILMLLGMYFMRQFSRGNEMQFKTNDPYTWFLLATAICWLFSIIFGIVFFCFVYDRVKISAKVLEISSFYLIENKSAFLLPVITCTLFIFYLIYYIVSAAFLSTIGTSVPSDKVPFGKIEVSGITK